MKADLLEMDYSSGLAALGDGEADVLNLGARLDTGYRFGSTGFFIDPQATVEYVYTEVDDMLLAGTTVASSGRTIRGRLGARVGTTLQMGGMRFEPSLMPSVWHLLDGDGETTFLNAGQGLTLQDERDRTYGEVSGIINMFGESQRLSGFLKRGLPVR